MRTGRYGILLNRVFYQSDEVPIADMRSAVFMEYTEAELLRVGCYGNGTASRTAQSYSCGNEISCDQRQRLISKGISKVIRLLSDKRLRSRVVLDKERQVVRVVRN
jgi:hypothetical protein